MSDLAFVVLDIETNGLEETDGVVLEVAAVGLDSKLKEVFRYSTPITQEDETWYKALPNEVADMHARSGLTRDVVSLSSALEYPLLDLTDDRGLYIHPYIAGADDLLSAAIHACASETVILCGSGVSHFDFRWLKYHMPKTASCFKHYTIDVGMMRRWYRAVVGDDLSAVDQRKTHRALDDVDCHLEELIEFAALFVRDATLRDYIYATNPDEKEIPAA